MIVADLHESLFVDQYEPRRAKMQKYVSEALEWEEVDVDGLRRIIAHCMFASLYHGDQEKLVMRKETFWESVSQLSEPYSDELIRWMEKFERENLTNVLDIAKDLVPAAKTRMVELEEQGDLERVLVLSGLKREELPLSVEDEDLYN